MIRLLLLVMAIGACQAADKEQTMVTTSTLEISYLALGDSYTIGEAVERKDRWPIQLTRRLNDEGIAVAEPKIIATTGWTTDELKAGIEKEEITDDYDMVSLLIGVNNQYRGYSLDEYKAQFEELLNMAIDFAGGNKAKVFVVSIPDYGVTPFGQGKDPKKIGDEVDRFNAANKAITDSYGIQYFDITPVSKTALGVDDLNASDGLHPSGKMYTLWVEIIFPGVRSMLEG